ncbi:hypothetical protein GCM10010300_52540 [Streptomyces olivaceoviridis]|nr:hypothetical protein GCM10010300_52540 [Streptomyces olivaceoviridis]
MTIDLPEPIAAVHAAGMDADEPGTRLGPFDQSIWFAYRRPNGPAFGLALVEGPVRVPDVGETITLWTEQVPLRWWVSSPTSDFCKPSARTASSGPTAVVPPGRGARAVVDMPLTPGAEAGSRPGVGRPAARYRLPWYRAVSPLRLSADVDGDAGAAEAGTHQSAP